VKLLIFGHWSDTGFGRVTQELGSEFLNRGIDVRVLAVNHRGAPIKGPLAGRVWPANMYGEPFGGNLSSAAIDGTLWRKLDRTDHWKPDQVLVISDFSGFQGHIGPAITPAWLSVPVWHYCPIEGDNLPASWRDVWNDPSNGKSDEAKFLPVAMSEYGRRVVSGHLGRDVPMIYHGVDTDTFRPVAIHDPITHEGRQLRTKAECKAAFGFTPNQKVILRYDRHVPRKFYHLFLRAMTPLLAADPDAVVVMHCRTTDEGGNLLEEIARMPREVWAQVKLTNAHDTWTGLPTESLVALINAADVYVSTTSGEGFGLTLAESLACGVPVVVTDWAAEREVVGPGGVLIPPLHDSYGEPVRYHSTYGMDWAVPDARAFTEPVQRLLAKSHQRKALGDAGRQHVKRTFRWSQAADQFVDLFASVVPAEVAA
jgi:glycosyltransferase involved in cell wall biosynthesis